MALVTHIVFGVVANDMRQTIAPALIASSCTCESKTPSGSNQVTTMAASAKLTRSPICRISTDVAIYVSFGASPNATSDAIRFHMPASSTEYFYVEPGDKAAIVTS